MGSIPNIPFINFNVIFQTDCPEFVLEGKSVVVGFLVVDVVDEFGHVCFAHGEKSIAFLPGEIGGTPGLLFNPLAGLSFEDVDQLCTRNSRMQADRQVYMVVHSAHAVGVGFGVVHHRGHHCEKIGTEVAIESVFTVFGAENEVNQVEG